MNRNYKSKSCQKLYDDFKEIFQTEGNSYNSLMESIEEGYDHHKIDGAGIGKMLVVNVLKDATIDFLKDKVKIQPQEKYLDEKLQVQN